LRFLFDDPSELLLGADEEHTLTPEHDFANSLLRGHKTVERLAEVDDVDPVAFREDESLHLRVPTTGLVAEVYSGLEKLIETNVRHDVSFSRGRCTPRSGCRVGRADPVEQD
jgi:hypothetical protein